MREISVRDINTGPITAPLAVQGDIELLLLIEPSGGKCAYVVRDRDPHECGSAALRVHHKTLAEAISEFNARVRKNNKPFAASVHCDDVQTWTVLGRFHRYADALECVRRYVSEGSRYRYRIEDESTGQVLATIHGNGVCDT